MEFVGQPRTSEACNLLDLPGLTSSDVDDDEGELVIGIRPKSSPLPRRKSSVTDDDSEPEPPLCGSRRVSFADAKGLSLVQVKEFETWDEPKLPGYDFSEGEGKGTDKYFLSLHTFSLPLSADELFLKVQDQKVELETIKLLPGTTIIKGVIRVLNVSFSKTVYVRTTLDGWCSHFDLLAEYIPGSSDGLVDSFSFKLTLVPPFGEQGARVDFCLRYETPVGTFWANNNNRNYVLFCHRGMKDQNDKPQKENVNKKSCLKPVSQNLTENISAVEASSQENISTVGSTQEEERNTVKSKQIFEKQPETSEEGEQKLQAENEQNSSRKSRRRAARMARLRGDFAQRYGEADDTVRDATSPDAKQVAKEENPVEKPLELQSFSEASRESEGFQFVSETGEKCTEPLTDVINDTLQAHNYTSKSVPKKSECSDLSDSAKLTGGESATDILDNPLHSNEEPASAESQNINEPVSKADGENLKQSAIDEGISSIASEPADSVISAVSSESLVSQANSYTFGTVVAPLYRQVFGRMGSENLNLDNRVNPVWATTNVRDITQSYYHTTIRENSSAVGTDTTGNNERVQENYVESQESNREHSDAVVEEKEEKEGGEEDDEEGTSFNVMENDTLQDPIEILHSDQRYTNSFQLKPKSGDTEAQPHIGNILDMDLGNALVSKESLYSHEEAQADDVTFDLQSQAVGETPHAQLSEHKCLQVEIISDETPAQIQTEEVKVSGENVFKSVEEAITDNEMGKTVIIPPSSVISEENKPEDVLHDLNSNPTDDLFTKESASRLISCCKIVDENNFSIHETSLETQDVTNDVEQQNKLKNNLNEDEANHSFEIGDELTESMTNANQTCGDIGDMELKNEQLIVSQKEEHCEIEAAVSKEEDFSFAEPTKVKNWEIMVKEEENNILTDETDEKESKVIYLKDTEAEGGKGEQLGDTGIETASENRDTKERGKGKPDEARTEEITDPGKKESKTEDADVLEVEHSIGEEDIGHIVARKNSDVEKKFEYVKTTQMETIAGEDETEVEKIEEQEEKEKHFTEMEEVTSHKTNAEKKEDIEAKEKIKIGLKAGVVREDQKEKGKEEKRNYKDEAGEAEIVDADSEGMTLEGIADEVGCFEERLDIADKMLEDGLFGLLNNLKVRDNENTGEGHHAHIPMEMHFSKEEDFESNKKVTRDRSKPKSEYAAVEGCLSILTDEPESDHTSHGSASAESDSDDEVELYMHCLKAVHTGRQPTKEQNKGAASAVSKRASVSRSKHVSTPMPPISESLDEEPQLGYFQGNDEDMERTDIQPSGTTLSGGQDRSTRNIAWWKNIFSYSNISKTLLCAILLVVFLVVAYHYDFLACFGLYLVSVVWLCCQGETQPVKKNNNRLD